MQEDERSPFRGPVGPSLRQRIGSVIKCRRLELGYSLGQLARAADVSQSHLSRIERGLSIPSYQIVGRLAALLGIDDATLRNEEEAAEATDRELNAWLQRLEIPEWLRSDFLNLLPATREALVGGLDELGRHADAG